MNFTPLLDTAIGLALVYLGASLIVSLTNESIAGILGSRGKHLKGNLERLLKDSPFGAALTDNPVFQETTKRYRSYADPMALAQVIVGSLLKRGARAEKPADLITFIEEAIKKEESSLKTTLVGLAHSAGTMERFTRELSVWLDRSLTVMGEAYKRWAQVKSFIIGAVVAVLFNIDSLAVAERLYRDKELRDVMATAGEQYVQATSAEVQDRCTKMALEERKQAAECAPMQNLADALAKRADHFGRLPIGWNAAKPIESLSADARPGLHLRLAGWLLTALALMLGAPFWFDVLNRVVNVRSGMRRPEAEPPPNPR
jgi:hypothetical protein